MKQRRHSCLCLRLTCRNRQKCVCYVGYGEQIAAGVALDATLWLN
jgi:hypothetical protein